MLRVAVVQRSEARRRLAAELGADAVLEPGDDVAAALGALPAAALVTAPGVEALSWAIDHVDVGGRVHAFAGTPGGAPVDANIVHYRHLRLVGSTGSTVEDYRRARDLARSGAVPLDRMPSRTVALDEVPEILLDPEPGSPDAPGRGETVGSRERWFVGRVGGVAEHPDDPIRVALIGYGLAGAVFHGPLISSTPGMSLATIVTGDPERRARASSDHPEAVLLDDVEALWDRQPTTTSSSWPRPTGSTCRSGSAALEAGLPVVIDKPMAPTADGGRRLVTEAAERDLLLTVFQNRRWDGDYLTVRRLLAEDALGPIVRFESRFERWRPEVRPEAWRERGDPEEAGGLLFDLGAHLIDQAVGLFGPPRTVYAEVDRRRPGAEIDDDVFVALEHAEGVRSHLWMSVLAAIPGPRMRVLGQTRGVREVRAGRPGTGAERGGAPGRRGLGPRAARAVGAPVQRGRRTHRRDGAGRLRGVLPRGRGVAPGGRAAAGGSERLRDGARDHRGRPGERPHPDA